MAIYAFVVSLVLLKVIDWTMGLRVTAEAEMEGLGPFPAWRKRVYIIVLNRVAQWDKKGHCVVSLLGKGAQHLKMLAPFLP